MDNEEKNYDNGGWQNPDQTGGFDTAESSQTSNDGNYSAQSQNNDYYNQPQNGNGYSDQSQNGNAYFDQSQNDNYYSNQSQNNDAYYNQPQNGNGYYNQPQNNNAYYNQPQNGNGYYNQSQNTYPSQSGDGFRQSNDGFNRVNNQSYQNYVPEPEEGPGYAIAGMVFGILSILCCCQPFIAGVLAIVGMVFSIIVLKDRKPGKGMAIAGVVCSSIGIVIALTMIAYKIFILTNPGYVNNIMELYREDLYRQMN